MTIHERISAARETLTHAGLTRDAAAIDAEVLARHALGWDRARLLVDGREPLPDGFDERFGALVGRRARREPVAMITGSKEFWGLEFEVSPAVLIPRPETEFIVEAVCDRRSERDRQWRFVDVGTGSGCIAIALATEFRHARIVAIDISDAALAVAARNAARHGVADRIPLLRSDLLDALDHRAEVIVANPPYVPAAAGLSPDITRYEPSVALYSGSEGMTALDRLIRSARSHLVEGGLFVVEFGFGQDEQVDALARQSGWSRVEFIADLQEIPRVAILTN
jgi:release factor glutamine methyltransferase